MCIWTDCLLYNNLFHACLPATCNTLVLATVKESCHPNSTTSQKETQDPPPQSTLGTTPSPVDVCSPSLNTKDAFSKDKLNLGSIYNESRHLRPDPRATHRRILQRTRQSHERIDCRKIRLRRKTFKAKTTSRVQCRLCHGALPLRKTC